MKVVLCLDILSLKARDLSFEPLYLKSLRNRQRKRRKRENTLSGRQRELQHNGYNTVCETSRLENERDHHQDSQECMYHVNAREKRIANRGGESSQAK